MQQVTDSLIDPADHLALDETLLTLADEGRLGPTIRTWEMSRPTVVLGRSSRVADEVDQTFCAQQNIEIYRRCSGGASVVGGPGCLMYSVVLNVETEAALRKIDVAHQYVISRVLAAVQRQLPAVQHQGICDLTWNNRKCSGNSLKIARHHLLYHGTILYRFDLDTLSRCLRHAPRQPQYRDGRDHHQFVTNVPIDPVQLRRDLCDAFQASGSHDARVWQDQIAQLRSQRYDVAAWRFRH